MKHIFIPFTILIFIMGCGLMNNPKEESESIHVPQNISVEIPDVLKSDNNKTNRQEKSTIVKKPQNTKWYN